MPCDGDLQIDSPALFGSIQRRFDTGLVSLVVAEYRDAAAAGGNREVDFSRPEEASFNPRMARIASLVSNEGGFDDIGAIRAVLWSCVPGRIEHQSLPSPPSDLIAAMEEDARTRLAATIFAALQLDRARHLHLTEAGLDFQRAFVMEAQDLVDMEPFSNIAPMLRNKLIHALAMQSRRIGMLEVD